MHQKIKNTKKMKVFTKGQVVIPVDVRRRYDIKIGDRIEFIQFEDGIFLKPAKQKPSGRSLTDGLFGVLRSYAKNKAFLEEETINQTAEAGFANGWTE